MTARRSGFLLIELVLASALLAIVFAVCTRMIVATAAMRRSTERQQAAIQVASNAMERVQARPWNELPDGAIEESALAELGAGVLPGSTVDVVLDRSDTPPSGVKITVSVTFPTGSGDPPRTVELVAWRHPGRQP